MAVILGLYGCATPKKNRVSQPGISITSGKYEVLSPHNEIHNGQMIWISTIPGDRTCRLGELSVRVVKLTDGRQGCLMPIPFHTEFGERKVVVENENNFNSEIALRFTEGDYPKEKLSVDGKYVEPPKKVLKRIAQETKMLAAAYKNLWEPDFLDLNLKLPVSSEVTSKYGNRRFYNNIEKNFHAGTDLRAKVGTPIYSPSVARVEVAQDLYFTGNTVILNHGYDVFTIYAHMSALSVKVGQIVNQGDLLGKAGATGRVSGPHLHWGLNISGQKVDPMALMNLFGSR